MLNVVINVVHIELQTGRAIKFSKSTIDYGTQTKLMLTIFFSNYTATFLLMIYYDVLIYLKKSSIAGRAD